VPQRPGRRHPGGQAAVEGWAAEAESHAQNPVSYAVNGKALSFARREGYVDPFHTIAKPYPGMVGKEGGKMPPPTDLIRRGLKLCEQGQQ
jgi:hypothetical protein